MFRFNTEQLEQLKGLVKLFRGYQLPSEFFAANNRKPTVFVKAKNDPLDVIGAHLSRHLEDLGFSFDSVVYFLYKYLQQVEKVKLTETWQSYGVVIGESGAEVGPLDLLEVKVSPFEESLVEGTRQVPVDALAYGLLAIHKVIRIDNAEHLTKISSEVNAEMLTRMGVDIKIALNLKGRMLATGSQCKGSFNNLVAAVDMFFHKFPNHEKAFLRTSTMESRYRCCAALTSYEFIKEYIGATGMPDMRAWIWNRWLANDINRIFKDNEVEEISNIDSYFPYQADLALVRKTAYSSVMNPYLFLFLHMVGSVLGSKRSMNAKKFHTDRDISSDQAIKISWNALVMSYVYSDPLKGLGPLNPEADHTGLKATYGLDRDKWFDSCVSNGEPTIVPEIRNFGKRCINHLQHVRKGTIGEYTKNYLQNL